MFPLNRVTSGQGVQLLGTEVFQIGRNLRIPGEDFKGKGEGEEECTILDNMYFVHRRYILGKKKEREFDASRRLNRIKDKEREKERVCAPFLNSNYIFIINGIIYRMNLQ